MAIKYKRVKCPKCNQSWIEPFSDIKKRVEYYSLENKQIDIILKMIKISQEINWDNFNEKYEKFQKLKKEFNKIKRDKNGL